MTRLVLTLCIVLLLLGNLCVAQNICAALNIGSAANVPQYHDDIVKNGTAAGKWLPESTEQILASPHKALEYFYINDLNLNYTLDKSNVQLNHTHPEQADSTISIREDKKGWYVIEVNYECKAYGGFIISYEINVTVPECGTTAFKWKKLCGNPFTERSGLTVEARYGNDWKAIVRNGRIHKSGLTYDREVDDYALRLPVSVDSIVFDIYLNEEDMKNNKDDKSRFSWIPQQSSDQATDVVWIDRILADSDQNVLDVVINGDLARQGAIVSKTQRQRVEMLLNCHAKKGFSTIEIDIGMPSFRDIGIFLVKECEDGAFDSGSRAFWIFLLIFCVYLIAFYLSNKKGKSFPLHEKLANLYKRARSIRIRRGQDTDGNELKTLTNTKEDDEEFGTQEDKKNALDNSKYGTF